MGDKLTKQQRMYLRDALHKKQNGKCYFCSEGITVLKPGDVLTENWRRTCLIEDEEWHWRASCQRCGSLRLSDVMSDDDRAKLDQMIAN